MVYFDKIQDYKKSLFSILTRLGKCSFFELKRRMDINDTDLCLALCLLIKENRIYQRRAGSIIEYGIIK